MPDDVQEMSYRACGNCERATHPHWEYCPSCGHHLVESEASR